MTSAPSRCGSSTTRRSTACATSEVSFAPTIAFNHRAATEILQALRRQLAPTRRLAPAETARLSLWLDQHGDGGECEAGGCTENPEFEPLAAEPLRLLRVLAALHRLEWRWPSSVDGATLATLAEIAEVEAHGVARRAAAALIRLASEAVDPRDLGRHNPRQLARLRALEQRRGAADPPIAELVRMVEEEPSGPALCAACMLLEHDVAAHHARVLRFTREFPPGIPPDESAAPYAAYARLLNAWADTLVHVDPALWDDPERLLACTRSGDPGLACAAALASWQKDPASRARAAATARLHATHPLAEPLRIAEEMRLASAQ